MHIAVVVTVLPDVSCFALLRFVPAGNAVGVEMMETLGMRVSVPIGRFSGTLVASEVDCAEPRRPRWTQTFGGADGGAGAAGRGSRERI
jgi:hypothetical protein